ncbi:hypothetical protein RM697_07865 [Ichthyenterobacterium sp. W332]|uniref:TonB C-terminal domain-containing protein n=1 Tax=Microcosmobacter mediterraneus TaxID=3075607 RepID=A0ABU2YL59_9FLAO|nr:hypothetical protein [Ichthyenterobacterium sp. W332]MDT0558557.1 hypothetical protein [Ichthyenterobacterium sp. W332]
MKTNLTLVFILLIILNISGQTTKSLPKINSLQHVEQVPVYKGCDSTKSNAELKKCMSNKMSRLIGKYFNQSLAANLGLKPGEVRVLVIFKINTEGIPIDIRARAPHKKLEKEAIRVVKLIPKFDRPGLVDGKPVIVPYSLPIRVVVPKPKKKQKHIYEKQ